MRQLKPDTEKVGMTGVFFTLLIIQTSTFLSRGRLRACVGFGFAAALVFALLPAVIGGQSATFEGGRYWWLFDDAMISMQYGRNLATGLGLVWNPGERVEGYTNFLWVIWMAVPHLLGLADHLTSLFILLSCVIFGVLCLLQTMELSHSLGNTRAATFLAALLFVVNRDIGYWTISGLETCVLALLVTASVNQIIRKNIGTGVVCCIALIPLVRSDAIVLSGILASGAFICSSFREVPLRRLRRLFAAAVFPFFIHLLFRRLYYGVWIPNTALLKTTGWPGKWEAGADYAFAWIGQYALFLSFALISLLLFQRERRKSAEPWGLIGPEILMFMIVGLQIIYSCWAGGDAFENFRFMVPVVPLLIALATRGTEIFLLILQQHSVGALCLWVAGSSFLLIQVAAPSSWIATCKDRASSESLDGKNVKIGLLLRTNTAPGCVVADTWVGNTIYFARRRGLDLLGKTDPMVAKGMAHPDGKVPGHNKFNYPYSLGSGKPDFVVSSFRLPIDAERAKRLAQGNYAFVGELYLDPTFQKEYFPNPVASDSWRQIFARNGTAGAGTSTKWK